MISLIEIYEKYDRIYFDIDGVLAEYYLNTNDYKEDFCFSKTILKNTF